MLSEVKTPNPAARTLDSGQEDPPRVEYIRFTTVEHLGFPQQKMLDF